MLRLPVTRSTANNDPDPKSDTIKRCVLGSSSADFGIKIAGLMESLVERTWRFPLARLTVKTSTDAPPTLPTPTTLGTDGFVATSNTITGVVVKNGPLP